MFYEAGFCSVPCFGRPGVKAEDQTCVFFVLKAKLEYCNPLGLESIVGVLSVISAHKPFAQHTV